MKGQGGEVAGIPTKMMLLVFAVIIVITVFVFFLQAAGTVMYGSCWQNAQDQIKGLDTGKNGLQFGDCINKVTFTDDVSGFDCGIDEPKAGKIYAVIEPNTAAWYMYFVHPVETYQSRSQEVKCVELDYVLNSRIYWRSSEGNLCLTVATTQVGSLLQKTKC